MGATGRNWCCEHFNVLPDLLAFGKRPGLRGDGRPRIDEVKDNAFRLSSRLNSTWGGNFTDMVRSTHFLRIIDRNTWSKTLGRLVHIFGSTAQSAKGRAANFRRARPGLFLAFDLPDAKPARHFGKGFFDLGVLTLRSGENSSGFAAARHHSGSDR